LHTQVSGILQIWHGDQLATAQPWAIPTPPVNISLMSRSREVPLLAFSKHFCCSFPEITQGLGEVPHSSSNKEHLGTAGVRLLKASRTVQRTPTQIGLSQYGSTSTSTRYRSFWRRIQLGRYSHRATHVHSLSSSVTLSLDLLDSNILITPGCLPAKSSCVYTYHSWRSYRSTPVYMPLDNPPNLVICQNYKELFPL